MDNSLRTIYEHGNPVRMGLADHFFHRVHEAEHIGNLGNGDKPGLFREQAGKHLEAQIAVFIHRKYLQMSAFPLAKHLPGNDIGVMLRLADQNLVALADKSFSEAVGDQIDGSRRPGSKDDFLTLRTEEPGCLLACNFIYLSCLRGKCMDSAMDIGVSMQGESALLFHHGFRAKGGRRVIEIDQRFAVDAVGKRRE